MYLTYAEYTAYGGTITDQTAYAQYEFKARKLIDHVTYDRVSHMTTVPEAVKRCMFEIINLEYIYSANCGSMVNEVRDNSGKILYSFSNDGYSERYSNGHSNPGDYISEFRYQLDLAEKRLIYDYLAEEYDDNYTRLLYRGIK